MRHQLVIKDAHTNSVCPRDRFLVSNIRLITHIPYCISTYFEGLWKDCHFLKNNSGYITFLITLSWINISWKKKPYFLKYLVHTFSFPLNWLMSKSSLWSTMLAKDVMLLLFVLFKLFFIQMDIFYIILFVCLFIVLTVYAWSLVCSIFHCLFLFWSVFSYMRIIFDTLALCESVVCGYNSYHHCDWQVLLPITSTDTLNNL